MQLLLRIFIFSIIFCSYLIPSSAQKIEGTLYDSIIRQPIAFAYLTLDDRRTGTATDIDGKYVLTVPQGYSGNVTISHVSYRTLTTSIRFLGTHPDLFLLPASNQLQEVVVNAGENPAWEIIRKAVVNSEKHDPKNLSSYHYTSYNKMTATLYGKPFNVDSLILTSVVNDKPLRKKDTAILKSEKMLEQQHIFMSESVTDKTFSAPDKNYEKLLTYKVSGFNSPLFASLPTDYQPFGFYDEQVKIFSQDYLNPVSKNSWHKYDFELADTLYSEGDTVYVIAYEPLKGIKLNALKGQLSISTHGYAIKNIIAETADRFAKIGFRIQQKYELITGQWFPVQLNTDLLFREYKFNQRPLQMQVRSYLSEIEINTPVAPGVFDGVEIDLTAAEDSTLLKKKRIVPLEKRDLRTYAVYDSMRGKMNYFKVVDYAMDGLINGVLPWGKIDFDLARFMKFNRYEGVRFGVGIQTGPKFSRYIRMGAWTGYGVNDHAWKYGGFLQLNINQAKQMYVRGSYSNTITEPGMQYFFEEVPRISSLLLRDWAASRFDHTKSISLKTGTTLFRNWNVHAFGTRTVIHPLYEYSILLAEETKTVFTLSEAAVEINYAANQKTFSMNGRYALNAFEFPVISLRITHAFPGVLQSDQFDYTRYDVLLADRWKHRRLGVTQVTLCAGWLDQVAPLSRMYFGRGVKQSSYEVDGYFQTMGIYEFVSDKYASLFVRQNFGNVLINMKYSKPELMISQGIGYGALSHDNSNTSPNGIVFQSFNKGYFESGVSLRNLVRFNYFNIAFIGFGAGVFYRYGTYQFQDTIDNFALKMDLSFSF